jgi:hypothetical protein
VARESRATKRMATSEPLRRGERLPTSKTVEAAAASSKTKRTTASPGGCPERFQDQGRSIPRDEVQSVVSRSVVLGHGAPASARPVTSRLLCTRDTKLAICNH